MTFRAGEAVGARRASVSIRIFRHPAGPDGYSGPFLMPSDRNLTMRIPLTALFATTLAGFGAAQDVAEAAVAQDGAQWVTDWEQAKKLAAEQNKDLLVDFTGSDWCGWCIRLKNEVFDHAEFQDEASKHFVFVELDYPRDKSHMSEELLAQNERLKNEYGIQGYPTIFLTDAEGRPYAQTGYQQGGPVKYVEHLAELRSTGDDINALVTKAGEASGIEKAKLLASALDKLPESLHRFYTPWMAEIIKIDADNEAGLKEKFEKRLKVLALADKKQALMNTLNQRIGANDTEGALTAIETFRKENADSIDPGLSHELYYYQAIVLDRGGNTAKAIETLETAKKADPENPMNERLDSIIEQMKKKLGDGN